MKDNRRARKDSESSSETPDFVFTYSDSDSLAAEISEWYTYSEEAEFLWNADSFKNTFFEQKYPNKRWSDLTVAQKKTHIIRLLDQTENSQKNLRDDANRAILYLAQGVFKECEKIEEYNASLLENIVLLYECDTFSVFVDILQYEINNINETFLYDPKYAPCLTDNADLRVILSVLYTIIEVIRCYESEMAAERFNLNKDYELKFAKMKSQLKTDLNKPLEKTSELFSVYLFQLINKFCNQNLIILPIKKILLLLWKVLLLTLGGTEEAFKLKNELRSKLNLPIINENPMEILNTMAPATPPPNPIDIVNSELQFANPNSSYKRKKTSYDNNFMNGLTKQTKGIDSDDLALANGINSNGKLTQFGISSSSFENSSESTNNEIFSDTNNDTNVNSENDTIETNEINNESGYAESDAVLLINKKTEEENALVFYKTEDEIDLESEMVRLDQETSDQTTALKQLSSVELEESDTNDDMLEKSGSTSYPTSSNRSPPSESETNTSTASSTDLQNLINATNNVTYLKLNVYNQLKTLPWKPKVRLCELEAFLDQERKKFLGYGDLENDLETLIGLPYPIHESVKILKQHLYISLADEQIKFEEKLHKYPMSTKSLVDDKNDEPPASELLFMSLLNNLPQYLICLLKLLLTSVPQTKPKGESLQIMSDLFPEDLNGSRFFTIKLGIDSNRHKEILIKSISAIIFLMLKHFKINHIYQFEFMCQHLLFANCVPLILKFFNLNIASFIQSKNNYSQLDFPNCVIGEQLELDANELENGDSAVFRWRNVFSCINLLRILNKIAKYKRSRVMMLVIFKSAQIFKKVLRIKQAMLQYYALKLIKMQTRNMGRNWRKSNMSTMSAIYQKVRHRLNDDWAFGNELEAQAWDFQSEESVLRSKIDRFNQQRYKSNDDLTVNDFKPLDHSFFSAINDKDVQIPDGFSDNYEKWLLEEVYSNKINWDLLLDNNNQNVKVLY